MWQTGEIIIQINLHRITNDCSKLQFKHHQLCSNLVDLHHIFIIFLNVFYNRFLKKISYIYQSHRDDSHHFIAICKFDTYFQSLESNAGKKSTTKQTQLSHRSWISITQPGVDPMAALRKPLPVALSVAAQRRQKPIGRWRGVLRCIIIIVDPHSPLGRPHFLARVEYEAVGFPCIRYERFYLWLPAPGPDELWYCFGRFSESTRSVTRINREGEREREKKK